jgi:hypothetical protein
MRKRDKGPSAAWPRWIRLQKEKDGGAVEAAIAEQKALELKYPLTRAGKRKTTEEAIARRPSVPEQVYNKLFG